MSGESPEREIPNQVCGQVRSPVVFQGVAQAHNSVRSLDQNRSGYASRLPVRQ